MGDEKEMKIYSFGEKTKPAILLLPGTCCHWKRNFGHVIPLLQEHFYVLCASYDGFDETEDSTFPNMLIETAKLENYIQKNLGGQLFAAYGCSLGGSFVGLMVQRKKIHIRHGILGSSDLDQGSSFGTWAMAKAMTPLLGKMLRSGKLPVWAKKKMEEKAGAEYAQAMLQLFGCSAATQELPSMAFVSNTSIFNQFFYFTVDQFCGLFRIRFGETEIALTTGIVITQVTDLFAHTENGNHRIGLFGSPFQVVLCSGRDLTESEFFGCTSSQYRTHLIQQLFFCRDLTFLRKIPGCS